MFALEIVLFVDRAYGIHQFIQSIFLTVLVFCVELWHNKFSSKMNLLVNNTFTFLMSRCRLNRLHKDGNTIFIVYFILAGLTADDTLG